MIKLYQSQADLSRGTPFPWASLAPLACVLHCAGAPLFMLVAPALTENRWVEWSLMALAAALGIGSVASAVKFHGDRRVWGPVCVGLLFWLIGITGWVAAVPESVPGIVGGLALAAGMLWNARLRHRTACASCGCPAHE